MKDKALAYFCLLLFVASMGFTAIAIGLLFVRDTPRCTCPVQAEAAP